MVAKSNREILTGGKSYKQKAAKKFGADEVKFDKDSRLEYLTGFHKRKLDRQKKAKEFIQEQERKARLEERAKIRADKKKALEKQLEDFKQAMKDVGDYVGVEDDDEEAENGKQGSDEEAEEWTGFSDDNGDATEEEEEDSDSVSVKPILKKYVQTYLDDTTVDIEPLEPNDNFEYLAELNNVKLEKSEQILDQSIERAKKYAKFLGVEEKSGNKSKKNKKFRYLTKNERRQNQRKANNNKRRK
ncbi:rRNA-processing protein RRP17 [Kluyveromyces lactis]|uniref:KLLA0A02079p n=1 Tax=Kluyveromyces lactis (strain ATCC 8585 / CBS 2359 / DSM 70799 / NBRC 1267 / NRRL Y-1140 / WM37) TaxID=284590 RepID=Q6CY97_KLULA|nr:uncharacterized protein KLLA0_A02079g [Kluyveromyces lactis]CAH02680.1 KLLA0A02079p [Kluyveromyces lactis]|eukprot:XP_451092.1 uncharacterized protein KLLA0_A02079g [Kluyveromyces lactis]